MRKNINIEIGQKDQNINFENTYLRGLIYMDLYGVKMIDDVKEGPETFKNKDKNDFKTSNHNVPTISNEASSIKMFSKY